MIVFWALHSWHCLSIVLIRFLAMYFCCFLAYCHIFSSKLYSYGSILSWRVNVIDRKKLWTTWFLFSFQIQCVFCLFSAWMDAWIFPHHCNSKSVSKFVDLFDLFCLVCLYGGSKRYSLVSWFCEGSLVVLLVPLKHSFSRCLASSLGEVTCLVVRLVDDGQPRLNISVSFFLFLDAVCCREDT